MRNFVTRLAALILIMIGSGAAVAAEPSNSQLPTLSTANQAHSLTTDEAARAYPVQLKGVITYYDWITDPDYSFLFLHDESGSIFVTFSKTPQLDLYPGEMVSVMGVTNPGRYAPIITQAKIQPIGKAELPKSSASSLTRMLTGAEDGKWLDVKGVVLSAEVLDEWRLRLEVQAEKGEFLVTLMNYGKFRAASLVDSTVMMTGNCAPFFNTHRQLVGARLYVPDISMLHVIKAGDDPFSLPSQSIGSLMHYSPKIGEINRVRVRGVVTLALTDRYVLQSGEDATMVEPAGKTAVNTLINLGDELDTVGVQTTGEYSALLKRALFRRTGKRLTVPPVAVTPEQVLTGSYDMRLVQLEGRLIERRTAPSEETLVVSSKGSLVEATLRSDDSQSLRSLDEGSYVQLTGICSVQVNQNREPKGFRILLRNKQDAVVLHGASWWSVVHVLYLFLSAVAIALAVVAWVVVLRRRVAEQIDVIRRQLVEADRLKEKAEAASRAKSEFLANMSHEIRTPLNGVIGMTELAMSSTGLEQQEYHALIKSSGEALLVILNDILDYSKIEAGKIALESVDFNLEEVISSSIKSIAPSAHKKGLELTFYLEPDVPLDVIGDPSRLRQVLLNLAGNALKFTSEGEVSLRVSVDQVSDAGIQVHFAVRDTGVGIPKDKQRKLFQPFEQADSSTTRKFGGTGLGLAISAKIVQLMGGAIWIESVPGRGSTFHFTVRFGKSSSLENLERRTATNLNHLGILIIDDNATNRNILSEITSGWQMDTVHADSGTAGLRVLEQAAVDGHPFRLVLLDEQMPGMTSSEFVQRMKIGPAADTGIIMMLSSSNRSAGSSHGISNCLIKPVGFTELRAAIHRELTDKSSKEAEVVVATDATKTGPALSILVAEDNPVNQKLAVAMFGRLGHHVTLANNGLEAIQEWSRKQFDLVFMDVQMPEMDGLEATKQIRKQELSKGGRTPIIAMTANVLDGDRELCLAAGMDDYVSKPVSKKSLADVISRLGVGIR